MKTLLTLLAAVTVFGISAPANAAPPFLHQRRIVSYMANGMPVYASYQIVGYNAMGFPIYQWVPQPVSPVYMRPYHGHIRGYNYHPGYGRPYYGRPVGHGWGWGHAKHGHHH